MCEFANSKIPIKQQSLDLFIVKALYFYPLTTNLFQCVHLKIKAEQRSRFPMQLQRGIKPLDAGHITGIGEQHRRIAVHCVVLHAPIWVTGRQVLGENIIQNRPLFSITEQSQNQLSLVVAGQVVEVLVISIQYKVIPLSTAIIHQRNHPLHILAEHDGAQHSVLVLAWEPALT